MSAGQSVIQVGQISEKDCAVFHTNEPFDVLLDQTDLISNPPGRADLISLPTVVDP